MGRVQQSGRAERVVGRRWLGVVAALLWWVSAPHASALDFACVEASKYKYLYQLFDGDPRKFAAYLQIDPNKLPNPEFCRAAAVTGGVGDGNPPDPERLGNLILANRGWLAVLYLNSNGGSTDVGFEVGYLIRSAWLKTITAALDDGKLIYQPDFMLPPLDPALLGNVPPTKATQDLAKRWERYQQAIKNVPPFKTNIGSCGSACAAIHSGGIDRSGQIWVHRARYAADKTFIDFNNTMTGTEAGLQRGEKNLESFYREMDAGQNVFDLLRATPSQSGTTTRSMRNPRYVADYLRAKCGASGDDLSRIEEELKTTIADLNPALLGFPIDTKQLRDALQSIRTQREQTEQCIAAAHEKERLLAYPKLCDKRCDAKKLGALAHNKLMDLDKQNSR